MREMVWADEVAFHGVSCSDCGWLVPQPSMDAQNRSEEEWKKEIKRRFDAHDCAKHPRKPKPAGP